MKILTVMVICFLLYSCNGSHSTEIVVENHLKGIEFVHTADSFDTRNGQYKVYAMLRHTGKGRLKYLQLNASYRDANGKGIAQSIGGPKNELLPGDSVVIYTSWIFPAKSDLPYKVILNATN